MKERKIREKSVENGLKLFSIGLGLKVLLANQIGTLWNTLMSAGAGICQRPRHGWERLPILFRFILISGVFSDGKRSGKDAWFSNSAELQ